VDAPPAWRLLRRHERDVHGHWCDMVLYAVLNPRI
jgi:hypothetical protein